MKLSCPIAASATLNSKPKLSDEEFDAKFLDFFNRKDVDGYELRNALQELHVIVLISSGNNICCVVSGP